ncbi:MAG TPA: biosynthetic peptidoglycan transglycosylase [Solirubrobacteraceae bacterium]|nr:biosynthetic peptidoglycan transglycosylase [Solirubrobacteraceae bacterium]
MCPADLSVAPRPPRARCRRRHALRRLLAGVLLLAIAILASGAGALASLPGVGDAQRRARAIMRAHHERAGMPVPSRLAAAVIATEDEHFDENVVLNVATGIARAGLAVLEGQSNPGGATIDQQLAKALYGQPGGQLGVLREIGLGIKLGASYSHRAILAMYLNVNYYGNGLWGVRQAAAGYFDTTPGRLTWAQAALLAGLLQAPSAYNPLRHPALARQRRRHVLAQLVANHDLTAARAAAAARQPLLAG